VDPDTFLTELYVLVDDFCKATAPPEGGAGGRAPALSRSEVITLALYGQWARFGGERAFYRHAARHLRHLFPALPDRSQFNRLLRAHGGALVGVFLHLAQRLGAATAAYEALDGTPVPVRNARRRGGGWLDGQARIGWSGTLGWYEGFNLLAAVTPDGVLTGYGFGPASAKDQPLAETFFAARRAPDPRLPTVGAPAAGPYVLDKGFAGAQRHQRWAAMLGARVVCAPQGNHHGAWPPAWRRWLAGVRQVVETAFDKLHHIFGLRAERPHSLDGFQARLAARMALHNFCIWLNRKLGRPDLAFADLIAW
jgi:hypothetical protein